MVYWPRCSLSPAKGAEDFAQPRSREELRSLLASAGCEVTAQEFEELWRQGADGTSLTVGGAFSASLRRPHALTLLGVR